MKKGKGIVLFLLFMTMGLLLLQNVRADAFGSARGVSQSTLDAAVSVFSPVFKVLFGDYDQNDFFFAKLLLMILLYAIINTALRKVPQFENNKGINMLVSLIVSIFAVRFISQNQLIYGILLPYGTLGVALITILPFLIFFLFVNWSNMGGAGRRLSWIFFGIIFFVLWIYQADNIGPIANQIYGWTMAALVLVFIFDKNIHYYFKTWEISAFYKGNNERRTASLQAEYLHLLNVNTPAARHSREAIERELKSLNSKIP